MSAADGMLAGRLGSARSLLGAWRFADDERLVDRLLGRMIERTPQPTGPERGALASTMAALPGPGEDPDVEERFHRERLASESPSAPDTLQNRLAWGLDSLGFLGREITRRRRAPWAQATCARDPRDARTRQMWHAWCAGSPWAIRESWEELFLPAAIGATAKVLRARNYPREAHARILRDVAEGFFFLLLGDGDGPAPWSALATRVIEIGPADPVDVLAACLDAPGWRRVALCAVSRGYGPRTAALAYPDRVETRARARALLQSGQGSGRLGRILDLHVACRLVDCWAQPGFTSAGRSWRVIDQNRGRARARLRAVLADAPGALEAALTQVDAPYQRTRAAVARFWRDWTWDQLSRGFSFSAANPEARCHQSAEDDAPYDGAQRQALQSWVMLVIFRARLGHLLRWIETGSTGDRDTTWGRLLSERLPSALRGERIPGDAYGLARLRSELAESQLELFDALRPLLDTLAGLEPGSGLASRFDAALGRFGWHPAVPRPRARIKRCVEQAALARVTLDDREPWR